MKKYSLLFLMAIGVFAANAQETRTKAHPENFRSWSLGVNVGNSILFGDFESMTLDGKQSGIPDEAGGFNIGVRGELTKFFNPTFGLRGSAGFHDVSGYKNFQYSEGNMVDGSLSAMINLSNLFLRGRSGERKNSLLVGLGLGISAIESERFAVNPVTGTVTSIVKYGTVNSQGKPKTGIKRAMQLTSPLEINYKRKLSNAWDLDVKYTYLYTLTDYLDGYSGRSDNDKVGYIALGVTYNFKNKNNAEAGHVMYINPIDEIFATVEEVKNNFDQLTTDDDKDGVNNFFDKENNTPDGVVVDGSGKAADADQDGIPDYMDEDPFTSKGAKVDANGRAVDSDGDGVADYMDKEPNTEKGTLVNFQGKAIAGAGGSAGGVSSAYLPSVYFAFNSATVSAANHDRLAAMAMAMKNNPGIKVTIIGHSDSRGSEEYNKNLAQRRAEAVVKQLVQVYGIDEGRLSTQSTGEAEPLANGRHDINRRADAIVK